MIFAKDLKGGVVEESVIKAMEIKKLSSIMEIGFKHSEQILIISEIQSRYIPDQCNMLFEERNICEKCGNKAMKSGKHTVSFHASLSDHKFRRKDTLVNAIGNQSQPYMDALGVMCIQI